MSSFAADPLRLGRALKSQLRSGDLVAAAFLKVPSPDLVEILGMTGIHCVVADAEHGPADPEGCLTMVRAGDACGIPVLVRTAETDSLPRLTRYLDSGVSGVIVPRFSDPADGAVRLAGLLHPPYGSRGLAAGRWARYGFGPSLPELVHSLPSSMSVIVQIEEIRAVHNLDALLELSEPDVYFIGPTDLACSMGLAGDKSHEKVRAAVQDVISRIVAAGRTAGVLASSISDACSYKEQGARFLAFNAETLLTWGIASALSGLGVK